MNHYQRLKVSQDAPAEVIRAAYRALATKLHPDRQGPHTGPQDVLHSEMAALNGAYETLIDPKLRADYDATLLTGAMGGGAAGSSAPDSGWFGRSTQMGEPGDQGADAGPQTRVDMDWLTPGVTKAPAKWWPPSRQNTMLLALGGGSLVVALGWGIWNATAQRQVDDALSRQYSKMPAAQVAAADGLNGIEPTRSAGARKPSVDELARMSDEELLRVLPTLDDDGRQRVPHAASFAGMAHHPLDGAPLRLRSERELVDPLAPEPR
jgi:curved DNA-binding protein CbpA